jgi:hypothetical protein
MTAAAIKHMLDGMWVKTMVLTSPMRLASHAATFALPMGRWCSPRAEFPNGVSPLAAPYSPPYRLALVKPEWSVGQNVVDPASIRRPP